MKRLIIKAGSKLMKVIRKLDTSTDELVYNQFYPADSIRLRRFYNVGAGSFSHPCWTNIDGGGEYYDQLYGKHELGIYHDLFTHAPVPVESNTAELIYTSHTIEHVDNASVANLFTECFRMLKPGGILRIVTVDIELSYNAWRRNDRKFFFWVDEDFVNRNYQKYCLNRPLREASTTQIFLEEFAPAASEIALVGADKRISDAELKDLFEKLPFEEALDYCISFCKIEFQRPYPFRHMNWFHEKKLRAMLEEAGFKHIFRSAYLQSTAHVLRNAKYFDQTLPQLSIYMEAVKQ